MKVQEIKSFLIILYKNSLNSSKKILQLILMILKYNLTYILYKEYKEIL